MVAPAAYRWVKLAAANLLASSSKAAKGRNGRLVSIVGTVLEEGVVEGFGALAVAVDDDGGDGVGNVDELSMKLIVVPLIATSL